MQRSGVTNILLNAIIALVLVGLFFSTGFFVYSSFINSLTNSQVTKGFEKFISPIQDVCNGKSEATVADVSLPVDTQYTYGIIQTKVRNYQPSMPVQMKKCEDSYCLCLFRLAKPQGRIYEFWNDTPTEEFRGFIKYNINLPSYTPSGIQATPAPIWHFNKAGMRILPSIIMRIQQMLLVRIVEQAVLTLVPEIIDLITCHAGSGGAGAALCELKAYTIIHLTAGPFFAVTKTFLDEATEPFLFVNYPLNLMSTDDPEYLYWSGDDSCSGDNECCRDGVNFCGSGNYFKSAMKTASLDSTDIETIGKAVVYSLIDEGLNCLFEFISYKSKAGKEVKEKVVSTMKKEAKEGFKKELKKVLTKLGKKSLKSIGLGSLSGVKSIALLKAKEWVALSALDFDLPKAYRPTAYVKTLLGIRRQINIDNFVTMFKGDELIHPFAPRPPKYDYSFDQGVNDFSDLDILNCVAIKDLGPKCDSDTKVLMDYGYDVFLTYRITDPINNPGKSIFCGYNGLKKDYEINIFDNIKGAVSDALGISQDNEALSFLFKLLDVIVGDWFLGGVTSAQGMMMECVQSQINFRYRSDYFQYWIPYRDVSKIFGTSGEIGTLTATLTKDISESDCESSILDEWLYCVNNAAAHMEITLNAEKSVDYLSTDDYVCPSNGMGGCDYNGDWSNNITCNDVYHPLYLKCKPGIHLEFGGIIQ